MSLEKTAEAILEHEDGFHSMMNLWLIRSMVDHRGFTQKQIAEEMGISRNWLSQILSGAAYFKVDDFLSTLEKVEDAITRLSEDRGYLCNCERSAHDELSAMLYMSSATREMNDDLYT
jgi:transcriptional regulator with XRE-family HTH domain